MGVNSRWRSSVPPSVAPVSSVSSVDRAEHWAKNLDNSVNAVSFGFVATAVLISMFLVMAILERFLRPRSAATGGPNRRDLDPHMVFDGKLNYPSPRFQKLKQPAGGRGSEGRHRHPVVTAFLGWPGLKGPISHLPCACVLV